jgi:SAM-dependent methyltransferase
MTETDMFSQPAWEERYGARAEHQHGIWSGEPNAQLVAQAADLPPGRALEAGCGEGADAMWLAEHGWRVTGVDFSRTALARAQAHNADVEWRHEDLTVWTPDDGAYDLVSAQFIHMPDLLELFGRLATGVAPGGTLLIVGHDLSDPSGPHRPQIPGMFFTADEVVGSLDPRRWEVLVAEARPRAAHTHEGTELTVRDIVVHARRRP